MDATILIRGQCLKEDINYELNIMLQTPKVTIMRGIVYDAYNAPSIGAAIEVKQIEHKSSRCKILGYTFTNSEGEYVFSLVANPDAYYEIIVYSPLSKKQGRGCL